MSKEALVQQVEELKKEVHISEQSRQLSEQQCLALVEKHSVLEVNLQQLKDRTHNIDNKILDLQWEFYLLKFYSMYNMYGKMKKLYPPIIIIIIINMYLFY